MRRAAPAADPPALTDPSPQPAAITALLAAGRIEPPLLAATAPTR